MLQETESKTEHESNSNLALERSPHLTYILIKLLRMKVFELNPYLRTMAWICCPEEMAELEAQYFKAETTESSQSKELLEGLPLRNVERFWRGHGEDSILEKVETHLR